MIRAKDCRNNSLFAFAAESADKDAFETVQEFLEQELTEKEVSQRFIPVEPSSCVVARCSKVNFGERRILTRIQYRVFFS